MIIWKVLSKLKQSQKHVVTVFLHSYAIGCRCKKKSFEGYKSTRPEWCPIERTTYHRQNLEVDKKEELYE